MASAPWTKPDGHEALAGWSNMWAVPITLASNGQGHAVLVWRSGGMDGGSGPVYEQLYAMTYDDGKWSLPQALTPEFVNPWWSLEHFAVAMDAGGNALATWLVDGAVSAKRFSAAASTWDADATTIGTVMKVVHSDVRVGMAAHGDATAVWIADGRYVYAARYIGGAWQPPTQLYESATGEIVMDDISRQWFAVNANGDAVAAWIDYLPETERTFHQTVLVTAELSGGVWTASRVASQTRGQYSVSVALDATGRALVASIVPRTSASFHQFQTQRRYGGTWSDSGSPWTRGDGTAPIFWAADQQGNFWAGWTDGGSTPVPSVSRLDAQGQWSSTTALTFPGDRNPTSYTDQYDKVLVALSSDARSGRPTAMWIERPPATDISRVSQRILSRALLESGDWGDVRRAGEAKAIVDGATMINTGPDQAVAASVYHFIDLDSARGMIWTNAYQPAK